MSLTRFVFFLILSSLGWVACGSVAGAQPDPVNFSAPKPNEAPPPRTLSPEQLQAWYGDSLNVNNDAQLARKIQSAESLVAGIFNGNDAAWRLGKQRELLALALPPMVLRAVVRHGRIPLATDPRKGLLSAEIPVSGYKDKTVKLALRLPEEYTPDQRWPLIFALHGAHGDGPQYIEHWLHEPGAAAAGKFIVIAPSADKTYGWGPASFGPAQAMAVLEWALANYRIDPDRVYMEGTSMGGYGAKHLAAMWPDRFAALSPRSAPPFSPHQMATMNNLHAIPMLSYVGNQDKLIAEKIFITERDEILADKLPAEMNILPGRGHEVFQDKDPDAVAFFEKHPRDRMPDILTLDSVEDGPGLRHYYVEIVDADTRGNQESSEIVLNGDKGGDPIIKQMQTTHDYSQYLALLKEAQDKGVLLENRKTWIKPREIKLHVDHSSNTIAIDHFAFVRQVKILVDDDLLDMSKEIVVKSGERVLFKRKVERSVNFLIGEMIRTGRRDITYWGALDVHLAY